MLENPTLRLTKFLQKRIFSENEIYTYFVTLKPLKTPVNTALSESRKIIDLQKVRTSVEGDEVL